jgi:SAM-dependent methyltransferase
MNWTCLRLFPWLDTRAQFVAQSPPGGTLLDLGASDGETLGHIAELRPDLKLFAADKSGAPEKYPPGCQYHAADFERDKLPWPDAAMDAITCMHLVEHLREPGLLLREIARLLKPGGRVYFETPHPKTLALPSLRGAAGGGFTMNFFDDPTHVRLVTLQALAQQVQAAGLRVEATGTSRNWLFAAAHPGFQFLPPSRRRFTARAHWLGWSACLSARRPA